MLQATYPDFSGGTVLKIIWKHDVIEDLFPKGSR